MGKSFRALSGAALIAFWHPAVQAADEAASVEGAGDGDGEIVVTAGRSSTKTETPLVEIPQPLTVIAAETYLSQGAINISDTVKYAAGVLANPYGRDTRVDGFNIRNIDALQFRDGMRDIFSYYASITADPYNFSRVEIVRGPASVLYGQGSIGGLVNLVSKTPTFETGGEVLAMFGSYGRKEALADVNLALSDTLAVRAVGRARDADTYVDHVPDDRVFFSPSIRWRPTPDTDITLLGLYQEDDSGSTSQFLPIIGTQRANPNNPAQLPRFLFVGKPGSDRYDGRVLQGGGSLTQRFGETVTLSLKARYIDSDLAYFTHYANSYANPTDPYEPGSGGRLIGLYGDASYARLNVFSTDNNLVVNFKTGAPIAHKLLLGVDYSWNETRKAFGSTFDTIDIYDIDYDAISVPVVRTADLQREASQKQLGFYVQDQIRFFDRVSVVLGARRDRVRNAAAGTSPTSVDKATTFRAGIIGEIGANISPFFSYTESFLPVSVQVVGGGTARPQRGTQYEAGLKWQPDPNTLVTVTGFEIEETNRPIYGSGQTITQSGVLKSKGVEIEASRTLPGNFELLLNYGYNKLTAKENEFFDFMPRHSASAWGTKTFELPYEARLRVGAGVNYTGKRRSIGPAWTIVTRDYTLVDGLVEVTWRNWRVALNATNLLDKRYFASCLARGDCFSGAPRNILGTIGYRF